MADERCPYVVGNTVKLQIGDQELAATITEVFLPFTFSCAMAVKIDHAHMTGKYVLKLYDRVHATQVRKLGTEEVEWTPDRQAEYQRFITEGHAAEFFQHCGERMKQDPSWFEDEWDDWTIGQDEAYMQFRCQRAYDTERKAYRLLDDLQGREVPRMSDIVSSKEPRNLPIEVPGLLLEHIKGFPMTDLDSKLPKEQWQFVCEEAIRIIHQINERGVINQDVQERSFIISKGEHAHTPRVCMLDFGHCAFKDTAQNEDEFRKWQAYEDQEGAVGRVMEDKLKGVFTYKRSAWAAGLDHDFMREEHFGI